MFKRAMGTFLSIALAVGLAPAAALATDGGGGDASGAPNVEKTLVAQGETPLVTQASYDEGQQVTLKGTLERHEVPYDWQNSKAVFYTLALGNDVTISTHGRSSSYGSIDLSRSMGDSATPYTRLRIAKLDALVGKRVSVTGSLTTQYSGGTFIWSGAAFEGWTSFASSGIVVKRVRTSIAKAKVTGVAKARVYTGKAIRPVPVVKLGTKTLERGTDYTVSYTTAAGKSTTPKKVGSYKVVVKGKGAYKGTVSKAFKIVPKATKISKLAAGRAAFTAKWKKASGATSYRLSYSANKSMEGAKTIKVSNATAYKKVKGLKGGKTYWVQVRVAKTTGAKTYYSAWSAKKSVKTKLTVAQTNKKAKAAFAKAANSLAAQSYSVRYKFADITGDGIVEMLVLRHADEGMWCDWQIYAWKSGSVVRVMGDRTYGEWASLTAYPKNKVFVIYSKGHGGESYLYYVLDGGSYRRASSPDYALYSGGSTIVRGVNTKEDAATWTTASA